MLILPILCICEITIMKIIIIITMQAVTLLLYGSAIRDVKEVTGKDVSPLARYLYPAVSTAAAVVGALSASKY